MKTDKSQVTEITVRWDESDPKAAGWYAEGIDAEGAYVVDSQKIWFGVDVDQFGEDESAKVLAAIRAEYTEAEVTLS